MSLPTQPYKGSRDFYPEDKRVQKHLFSVWRKVLERYGYEEYDAPVLENLEIYLAKTSEEIVNEQTFAFEDRGGRKVTLRPEMTPSVSRMVAAKRQELAYPLRWYSVPELWRYERPQKGRLRQHWQLNVDMFGVAGIEAEAEIIEVADAILQEFKADRADYTIRLNSRALMDEITKNILKLDNVQSTTLARLIDRMHKMEHAEFVGLLNAVFTPTQREAGAADNLLKILKSKTLNELPKEVMSSGAALKLAQLAELLAKRGITNAVYDPTLMRGFDYYTDIVFEVFDNDPENNRSMFGGGRYDGLVGMFGVEPVPTIGFGMGDVTFLNFLEAHNLMPHIPSETDAYVILIGDVAEKAQPVLDELRKNGVNLAVDITGRKLDKQLKTAVKKHIPYAIFIGEKELEDQQLRIKHLDTGSEEVRSIPRIVSIVKDYRAKDV